MRVSLFFRNERRRDRKRQGTGDFEWEEVIFAYVDFGCVFSLIFSLRFFLFCLFVFLSKKQKTALLNVNQRLKK